MTTGSIMLVFLFLAALLQIFPVVLSRRKLPMASYCLVMQYVAALSALVAITPAVEGFLAQKREFDTLTARVSRDIALDTARRYARMRRTDYETGRFAGSAPVEYKDVMAADAAKAAQWFRNVHEDLSLGADSFDWRAYCESPPSLVSEGTVGGYAHFLREEQQDMCRMLVEIEQRKEDLSAIDRRCSGFFDVVFTELAPYAIVVAVATMMSATTASWIGRKRA